jgi:hypothetical protein
MYRLLLRAELELLLILILDPFHSRELCRFHSHDKKKRINIGFTKANVFVLSYVYLVWTSGN